MGVFILWRMRVGIGREEERKGGRTRTNKPQLLSFEQRKKKNVINHCSRSLYCLGGAQNSCPSFQTLNRFAKMTACLDYSSKLGGRLLS